MAALESGVSKETKRQALSEAAQAVANVDKRKEEIARQAKIKSRPPREVKKKRRKKSDRSLKPAERDIYVKFRRLGGSAWSGKS